MAHHNRGIAQLVEQRSPKPRAVSSNLTAPANQGWQFCCHPQTYIEVWLSLVERFVRDEEAVGSNPVTSTSVN